MGFTPCAEIHHTAVHAPSHQTRNDLLIGVSLPMQGFASAVMLDRGSSHRHATQTSEDQAAPAEHGTHSTAATGHNHVASASDHHGGIVKSLSKCSACAACCFNTTVVPSTVSAAMPALDTAYAYGAPPAVNFTVNFPGGLERPPHTFPL